MFSARATDAVSFGTPLLDARVTEKRCGSRQYHGAIWTQSCQLLRSLMWGVLFAVPHAGAAQALLAAILLGAQPLTTVECAERDLA
jgi:hypothetical protein